MKKYVITLAFFMLTECVSNNGLYYWEDYTEVLYDYKVNPSNESQASYKESLVDIIDVSIDENKKIPPGIYFELGLVHLKEGNTSKGKEYIEKEKVNYPESSTVIQLLMQQMEAKK